MTTTDPQKPRHPMPGGISTLALAVFMLAAFGCGGSSSDSGVVLTGNETAGERLYIEHRCGRCHGYELEGNRTAPPLNNLAPVWEEGDLAAYMKDPVAVEKRIPRIRYMSERYPIRMPAIHDASDDDVRTLVAHLLSMSASQDS